MRQNDFENTPMLKLVMGLAIPSMIAQLVNIGTMSRKRTHKIDKF